MRMCRWALVVPVLLAPGCATILTGTQQEVRFDSDPPGATVTLENGRSTVAPGVIRMDKLRPHFATFELEGYKPMTVRIRRKVQWLVLGDVFWLIVPGLLVDFLIGGAYALDEVVQVALEPDLEAVGPEIGGP